MPIKTRRGYRSILVHIPTGEHELLERIAAENFRSIEQQASAMLTANVREMEASAIKDAVLQSNNGRLEDEIEERAAWRPDSESVEVTPAE